MPSTFSSLKIELMATGEDSGTWGNITNTNLGTALEEAITGSADVAYSSAADVTLTLTNSNASQTARNLRLNITESGAGIGYVGNLILGSGAQIEKLYLINNTTTGAKTVKNTTGTGVVVPAGKSMFVFNDGTNVLDAISYLNSLSLGSLSLGTPLGIASGGTGVTTAPAANAVLMGFTSTPTASGTTVLTNTSSVYQIFTGTLNQTITLPVTSTLQTGWTFHICNNSTGTLTVNSSGGNLVLTVLSGVTAMYTCVGTTLTTAADWEAGYTDFSTATGTGAVVLGTSPTLTTPTISSIVNTGTLTLPTSTDTLVGRNTTDTLTNKTITARVSSTTSIASPLAWNSDNFDQYSATAQAGNFTINADAGTPTDGRKIVFCITSDATPRVITFTGGASKAFKPVGVSLTVSGSNFTYTLTASKTTYFGAVYNSGSARWEIVALAQEA